MRGRAPVAVVGSSYMKISARIRSLFRRQPHTAEKLAARAEANSVCNQNRENDGVLDPAVDPRLGVRELPTSLTPPPF